MRIFIEDQSVPPKESVRKALRILLKAGVYSDGRVTIENRAAIIVNAESVRNAVEALNTAGVWVIIG
jgi:hypothetical protein